MNNWIEERRVEKKVFSQQEKDARILDKAQISINLLFDKNFQAVYHELVETLLDDIVASEPEEREKRENMYMQINGLKQIRERLKYWLNQGVTVNPKLEEVAEKAMEKINE